MTNSADASDNDLYKTDKYLARIPSLHEEDSPWKVSKLVPFVDKFVEIFANSRESITLMDVGGGAGAILSAISSHLEKHCGLGVRKYALDLSPGALDIQRRKNPDLERALNEDIRRTSLAEKEIDLALLVDLIEHVPHPEEALEEVRRTCKYAIFKVPLDDYLAGRIWNWIMRGEPRRQNAERCGHINLYTYASLRHQIALHVGQILDSSLTNVHGYYLRSPLYSSRHSTLSKFRSLAGDLLYRISPRMSALVFNDFAVLLVRCR